MPLISKDEPLKTSTVNVGYHILRALSAKKDGRALYSEITTFLKKEEVSRHRPITFALCFLYMAGTIEFHPPYISLKKTP